MLAAECGERSLLHAAGDFLERNRPADGGEIFIEKLVRRRQRGFGLAGFFLFAACRPWFVVCDDGCGRGIRRTAVARVAGDLAVTLEVVLLIAIIISIILRAVTLGFLSSFSFACATGQNSHSTPREAAMNCIEGMTWSAGI